MKFSFLKGASSISKRHFKPGFISDNIQVGDNFIPVNIYIENRKNCRVSLVSSGVNIRISRWMPQSEMASQIDVFKHWAINKIKEKGLSSVGETLREYKDGGTLLVGQRSFVIRIKKGQIRHVSAKISGNEIILTSDPNADPGELSPIFSSLISKIIGRAFQHEIEQRVHTLNNHFFRKKINQIRLKNNRSNWGSCSTKSNINLSTRLLFAPPEVIDYVIIHELAHLIEHNHSHRFWKLVEDAMPDYQLRKKWLKENGKNCYF